jgi:gamma-glutamyl:cysteine ligase YbdK (ATP-grasp superfamily)
MGGTDLAERVRQHLAADEDAYQNRVARDAEWLKAEIKDGTFDNQQALVGLEFELYGVNQRTGELRRLPRRILGLIGFEPELGLHNAEMNTEPQPLSAAGLRAQREELQARFEVALRRTEADDIRLVSDGMWTIPPRGEAAAEYIGAHVTDHGIEIGTNVSDDVRYHGIANSGYPSQMRIDTSHVTLEGGRPEMLTTSIQPHYQVPRAQDLPRYFEYAVRIAGPLVALGANSPFFPPDLYNVGDPAAILRDCRMENRIPVFESALNPAASENTVSDKVRFPRDIESVDEAIDRIVSDPVALPHDDVELGHRFDDNFANFLMKSGTYWRWVRPMFSAGDRTAANARIEFRPLSAQPTLRDTVAFQAVFAGLLAGLTRKDHPLTLLAWERAKDNFYAAVRNGFEADLVWRTVDGATTTNVDTIFTELFEYAREGLDSFGLTPAEVDTYVAPLKERVDRRTSPARWKHDRVAEHVDQGLALSDAIREMQTTYIDRQEGTFIGGTFVDWLDDAAMGGAGRSQDR